MKATRNFYRFLTIIAGATTALTLTPSASAQFSGGFDFLKAVKDRDGAEANKYINEPGSGAVIINTRDSVSGEGALHIVVKDRDATWLGFLLQKGADPDIKNKKGITPLMLATRLNFLSGAEWLLRYKADINQQNRAGETALITAVQLRNTALVRLFMKKGADPDITDNLAGMSARDYATRDRRSASILEIIENAGKDKEEVKQDTGLNFSGIGEEAK